MSVLSIKVLIRKNLKYLFNDPRKYIYIYNDNKYILDIYLIHGKYSATLGFMKFIKQQLTT